MFRHYLSYLPVFVPTACVMSRVKAQSQRESAGLHISSTVDRTDSAGSASRRRSCPACIRQMRAAPRDPSTLAKSFGDLYVNVHLSVECRRLAQRLPI